MGAGNATTGFHQSNCWIQSGDTTTLPPAIAACCIDGYFCASLTSVAQRGLGMGKFSSAFCIVGALGLANCTNTTIQGYADRNLPSKAAQHIAAYAAAPGRLASSMEANIAEEARKRGILAEDALAVLPPTPATASS